jgi:hypothetical protein
MEVRGDARARCSAAVKVTRGEMAIIWGRGLEASAAKEAQVSLGPAHVYDGRRSATTKRRTDALICLQRIHNFLCSMLVFTPFA